MMTYYVISNKSDRVIGIYTILKCCDRDCYAAVYTYKILPWIPRKVIPASIERIRKYIGSTGLTLLYYSESRKYVEGLLDNDLKTEVNWDNSSLTVMEDPENDTKFDIRIRE